MRLFTAVAVLAAVLVGGLVTSASAASSATAATAATGDSRTGRPAAVTVTDLTIPVPGQVPVLAYVVRPQTAPRPHSLAGVLFLHWFAPGQPTQNRSEYLAEAIELAGRGTVSVLPQLRFPWEADPVGDSRDRDAVTNQLEAVRRAFLALLAQPGVDPARTAVVGHDYGGMYGAMLAEREPRVRALVLMAGDATWANWFDTYWLDLPPERKDAYRALFHGLDPVDNVDRLGAHVFLQWGDRDGFITPEVRAAFAAANPAARATLYVRADHFLTQTAKDDRTAWLADQLHL